VRVRLDLGYDGTTFSGWAKQPGLRTVEGVLEDSLRVLFRLDEPPGLTVAGRTDAGVHARGQVAHCDLPHDAWVTHGTPAEDRLRGLLPLDVRVTAIGVAPNGFDARFSALSRRYVYRLSDARSGVDPIRRKTIAWHRRPLDVTAMNEAAVLLLGEHDFAAFCKRRDGASTVRTLRQLEWTRRQDSVLEATVVADAFCHNMVRSLVGTCVAVGEDKHPASWAAGVLASAARSSAVRVMPPRGLTFEEVSYPRDSQLASRAIESRQFRG